MGKACEGEHEVELVREQNIKSGDYNEECHGGKSKETKKNKRTKRGTGVVGRSLREGLIFQGKERRESKGWQSDSVRVRNAFRCVAFLLRTWECSVKGD